MPKGPKTFLLMYFRNVCPETLSMTALSNVQP